jgi:hypothetical protein
MVNTLGEDVLRTSFDKNVSSLPIFDRYEIGGEVKLEIAKGPGPFLVSSHNEHYIFFKCTNDVS